MFLAFQPAGAAAPLPMTALPSSGDALLAFKAGTEAPNIYHWGGAGVALDDPDERLAELDGFEEGELDGPNEIAAFQAASVAAVALRKASVVDTELAPWHAAMCLVLAEDIAEPELPVTIGPWLLLGDAMAAEDLPLLRSRGVTHVLNASNIDFGVRDDYAAAGIAYLQLGAKDEVAYSMRAHLPDASAFFRSVREAGGVCLCHCAAGINRSGFVVASELLLHERRELLDAVRHLKWLRGTTLLNPSFQVQLIELARDEGLLGAWTVDVAEIE